MSKRSKRLARLSVGPVAQTGQQTQVAPQDPVQVIPGAFFPGASGGSTASLVAFQAQSFSGPIPHPQTLQAYEAIVPGLAKEIVDMAKGQSAHRQDLERKVVQSDISKSYWGLRAAFGIAIAAIVGGSLVATYGNQPWAGVTIATGPVIGLVVTFLQETGARRTERQEKAKAMTAAIAKKN